jgi:hypothetical protein
LPILTLKPFGSFIEGFFMKPYVLGKFLKVLVWLRHSDLV